MLTYAPRPNPSFSPLLPLLVLVFWLGLLCWTKPAYGFHFKDYGPEPHLTPPDAIYARAVVLEDMDTGEVLYARNPDERLLPASTTKLMTALIVYERIGLKGSVTITDDDTHVEIVVAARLDPANKDHVVIDAAVANIY